MGLLLLYIYNNFDIFLFASLMHAESSSSFFSTRTSRYRLTTMGKPRLATRGGKSSIMVSPLIHLF